MVAYRRVLNTVYSNRIEALAEALCERIQITGSDPLQPDFVIVPGAMMQHWLTTFITRHKKICANINFQLPAAGAWQLLNAQFPDSAGKNQITPAILGLRIFQQLALPDAQALPELAALADGLNESECMSLADQLALLYDRYLVFRPDWIKSWENGRDSHWQARLWRQLSEPDDVHWAGLLTQLDQNDAIDASRWPGTTHIFSLPTVSPGYLHLMTVLAEHADVHWYQMNPSREYWADTDNPRSPAQSVNPGNELLGSMGGPLRDQIDQLVEQPGSEQDRYQRSYTPTRLGRLQNNILELRADAGDIGDSEQSDSSIRIIGCADADREVSVCHDQLLALFEGDPSLSLEDVLIAAPDIEGYLPFLSARFGAAGDQKNIPYKAVGVAGEAASRLIALLQSLHQLERQWSVQGLMELARMPDIQQHWGLGTADLDRSSHWLKTAGAYGPEEAQGKFSWRSGIGRLVAAWASFDDDPESVAELTPVMLAQEQELDTWLNLQLRMRRSHKLFSGDAQINVWHKRVLSLVSYLVGDSGKVRWWGLFQRSLADCDQLAVQAGLDQAVSLTAYLRLLVGQAQKHGTVQGSGGGVQVASLATARLIPARIIYLLGMNEEAFPRADAENGLDLMHSDGFRRGDRNERRNDRLVFLETLLSCRDSLFISYQDVDPVDASPRLMSSVVSELLSQYQPSDRLSMQQTHPIAAFDDRYGRKPGLFTYRAEYAKASMPEVRPFADEVLPQFEPPASISLDDFKSFFMHPARYFLQRSLNLYQLDLLAEQQLKPPLELDPLQAYHWREQLIRRGGLDRQQWLRELQDSPATPEGAMVSGTMIYAAASSSLAIQQQLTEQQTAQRVALEISTGQPALTLTGELDDIYPSGRVVVVPGSNQPKRKLAFWIEHLAYSCLAKRPVTTDVILNNAQYHFGPVEQAEQLLGDLVSCFFNGLQMPLPFFPQLAAVFVHVKHSKRIQEDPLVRCQRIYHQGLNQAQPLAEDRWNRYAFRGRNVVAEDRFVELIEQLWQPLHEHLEEHERV